MANEYKYGVYGQLGQSVGQSAIQSGTVPVYVGLAPVHLIRGYADAGVVNHPVKLTNLADAQSKVGISDDWGTYGIAEAIDAHFNNPLGNVGPIYVINVLDPDTMRKAAATTKTVAIANGTGSFVDADIILDTLKVSVTTGTGQDAETVQKTEGTDYTVSYNFAKKTVTIEGLSDGNITVTYNTVDTTVITKDEIIAGIQKLDVVYSERFEIPNLVAAPGWSQIPEVYNALVSGAQKIDGHWDAFVYADLPLVQADGTTAVDTIEKAIAWKNANGFTAERSKVFWPMAVKNDGKTYHLSTLGMVETLRIDYEHDSIPMETCGNKAVPVVKQYFGNSDNAFGQARGRDLAAAGITTVVPWAGEWVLWGDHTAAYAYGANEEPRAIFDVSLRMLFHITNSFQQEWSPRIDRPMTLRLRDEIINREQEKLDAYASIGALIGSPTVEFLESDNTTTDMMNGDFVWNILVTPTPPLKSATVKVAYTDEGFSVYTEEGE